jgi:hypothetical protein
MEHRERPTLPFEPENFQLTLLESPGQSRAGPVRISRLDTSPDREAADVRQTLSNHLFLLRKTSLSEVRVRFVLGNND